MQVSREANIKSFFHFEAPLSPSPFNKAFMEFEGCTPQSVEIEAESLDIWNFLISLNNHAKYLAGDIRIREQMEILFSRHMRTFIWKTSYQDHSGIISVVHLEPSVDGRTTTVMLKMRSDVIEASSSSYLGEKTLEEEAFAYLQRLKAHFEMNEASTREAAVDITDEIRTLEDMWRFAPSGY